MNIQPLRSDKELVKHLPLATSANNAVRQVVYSVPVKAKAGDILSLSVSGELTNPNDKIIGVGRYLSFAATPIDAGGALLIPARVGYIFQGGNHSTVDLSTLYVFSSDFTGFVNFCAYAYSPGGGADIIVNGWQNDGQAYGEIEGLLFTSGEGFQPSPPIILQVNYPPAPKKSLWQRIFG